MRLQPSLAHRAGRRRLGAGLGLVIVRRILELHGSMIAAESQPGAISRFMFALDIAAAEAPGA